MSSSTFRCHRVSLAGTCVLIWDGNVSLTSALIGDSSLLVRCAERLGELGLPIAAIATRSEQVAAWARAHGVEVSDSRPADPATLFAGREFDILWSVGNLALTPESVIARARRIAVNFHDGPLPGLAGLNAPAWAILEGRTTHEVTWHEMAVGIDTGAVAARQPFPIDPDETTFSLNAKCYEAGFQSFTRVLDGLLDGTLQLEPQVGERRVLSRSARPTLGGLIVPTAAPADIERLVRALDHGPYWNPLCTAKLLAGGRAYAFDSAERLAGASPTAPNGIILAREPRALVIAFAGEALRLSGLATLTGEPVDATAVAELAPGFRLDDPGAAALAEIGRLTLEAGKSELRLLATLANAADAELPYPLAPLRMLPDSAETATSPATIRAPLTLEPLALATAVSTPADPAVMAAVSIWLSRFGVPSSALLLVRPRQTSPASQAQSALFSAASPLLLPDLAGATPIAVARRMAEILADATRQGPLALDLPGRLARTDAPVQHPRTPLLAIDFTGSGQVPACASSHAPALTLVVDPGAGSARLEADSARISTETLAAMAAHLSHIAAGIMAAPDAPIAALSLVPPAEARLFDDINDASRRPMTPGFVDAAFLAQASCTPDRVALRWHDETLTYAELDRRSATLAALLTSLGAKPGERIAISLERTPAMVIALLAVLRTGAAYVPVDPRFPGERRAYILEDACALLLVTDLDAPAPAGLASGRIVRLDVSGHLAATAISSPAGQPQQPPSARAHTDLAYLTYTSGSTGRPKGVCVTHANVTAFLDAMDARIPYGDGGTWLAVTSISFDISVLELFWTLSRGFTVALASDVAPVRVAAARTPSLSLFYFADAASADGSTEPQGVYRLLLEGARFADANGFEAVWTPERHFHAFGGIYPNPAVTSAAVAAVTRRLSIRAGSIVLPLHDPLRVAEEWSIVDNLSGGRAGAAFAAGWMPEDFVLQPSAFERRKALMMEHIDTVQRLWRGERITRTKPNGTPVEIGTLPRPIQPRLPVWLTAARNPETFEMAGAGGHNVLTHLLGMSVEELAVNVERYRKAWKKAGHQGEGRVTLMLHTFVGDDDAAVRTAVRAPMKRYLASAVDIVKQAEWNFPTNVNKGEGGLEGAKQRLNASDLSEDELDALLDHAFDRYYETSALFGTPDACLAFARRLGDLGVDELACLVDFGVPVDDVLASLPLLADILRRLGSVSTPATLGPAAVAGDLVRHRATHFQCTPSMMAMIMADAEGRSALAPLDAVLVGGEALPRDLAQRLTATVRGRVFNMYGPTETTVWSTSAELDAASPFVPLGPPIDGTTIDIVNADGASLPALAAGELIIGGAGVTDGYWQRPELTAERFVTRSSHPASGRWYRTGDLARRHPDGSVEFLGRIDQQVKIRGHRIELGEIESALLACPGIAEAAVMAVSTPSGAELMGFVSPAPGASPTAADLKTALAARLPAIMVPATIEIRDRLPKTANGKLDRRALSAPVTVRRPPVPKAAPAPVAKPGPLDGLSSDELEARMTAVWSRLLGQEVLSSTANFFDLGGHSLLAVELHRTLINELAIDLKLTDIFRFPTVAALAAHVGQHKMPKGTTPSAGLDRARMRLEARRGRPTGGVGGDRGNPHG